VAGNRRGHPVLRRLLHGDEPPNEAIIFNDAGFGLFYATLLGLLTIETFQRPDAFKTVYDQVMKWDE
jgi:hypothetical protein